MDAAPIRLQRVADREQAVLMAAGKSIRGRGPHIGLTCTLKTVIAQEGEVLACYHNNTLLIIYSTLLLMFSAVLIV